MAIKSRCSNNGSITEVVNDFLAHLLVLDLLVSRDTSLDLEDLNLNLTVGSVISMVGGSGCIASRSALEDGTDTFYFWLEPMNRSTGFLLGCVG